MGRTAVSAKELSRAEVMGRVKAGNLRLREAGELLELSYRQVKRVWARYCGGGARALQHGNCGRRSNRAYAAQFRQAVLSRVRERYADFGPTLAVEYLSSDDGLGIHAESLRRWMREAGEIAIDYRGQRLGFRERLRASIEMSEARGAAPSSAPPSPSPTRWHAYAPPSTHPWRRSYQHMKTPAFALAR